MNVNSVQSPQEGKTEKKRNIVQRQNAHDILERTHEKRRRLQEKRNMTFLLLIRQGELKIENNLIFTENTEYIGDRRQRDNYQKNFVNGWRKGRWKLVKLTKLFKNTEAVKGSN